MMDNGYQEIKTSNGNSCKYYTFPSLLRLVLLGAVIITPAITPGMSIGYSAVALPQLNLTISEVSWFASIGSIATPMGNLFTGSIIDRYGRKPALVLSIIPSIIGWSVLSYAGNNLPLLYIGRVFTGFALGAASLPSSVYGAECITINNINLRGSLTTWTTLSITTGTLIVYILGSILSYSEVAKIGAIISTISFALILVFIPESPTWLYSNGRIGDAEWSQKRLGICQPILSSTPIGSSKSGSSIDYNNIESISWSQEFLQYLKKFKRKDIYKPLFVTFTYLFFLQFSGVYVLITYMVDILEFGNFHFFNPYFLTVIAGAVQLLATGLITFIIPYSGIRKLSITSCVGVTFGMFLLAFSLTCCNLDSPDNKHMIYMHVAAVWITVFSSGLGFNAIPFAILGELFPTDAKGFASISLVASSTFNFIVLKLHPYLESYLLGSVYYWYMFVSLLGTIFVSLCLPETVGKTFEEIRNGFLDIPTIKITER